MNNTDHTQPWENPCASEGLAIPASYKTPVMLPIYSQDVLDTTIYKQTQMISSQIGPNSNRPQNESYLPKKIKIKKE